MERSVARPASWTRQEEALNFSVAAGILSAVIGLIVGVVQFSGRGGEFIPVFGRSADGLATAFAFTAVIIGVSVTMFGYRLRDLHEVSAVQAELHRRSRRDWIQRVAVGTSMGILAGMGTMILFVVLSRAFIGAGVQWWIGALLLTGFGLVLGWVLGDIAFNFRDSTLIRIGLWLAYGTILFSAIVTFNNRWWEFSVSNLGTVEGSDMFFNFGILMAGVIILCYALVLRRAYGLLRASGQIGPRAYLVLQIAFLMCGIGVIGVGLFPYWYNPNLYPLLHDLSSHSALVAFVILMFSITRLAPIYPPVFRRVSFAIGIASLGVIVMLVARLALFAIAEVMWFVLWGTWLFLVERFTTPYFDDAPPALPTSNSAAGYYRHTSA